MRTRPSAVRPDRCEDLNRQEAAAKSTCESKTDVIVQHDDLTDSSGVLQLKYGLLLDTKDNDALAANTDLQILH